ncbi:CALCRL [Mytilus coruscus]|uniref:CALCRL n=1 Tax=Mytilus coruscus TaxID=42192 RepID=A0A6J8C0N7_MYTCO|nr:CALCRL [Mytilus coruscus]
MWRKRENLYIISNHCKNKPRRTLAISEGDDTNDLGNLYCNATTDTLGGCWNITRAGQSAKIPCPELMESSSYGSAYLNCTENGIWNTINGSIRGDYTHCQFWDAGKGDHLPVYVFITGNVVSIILLSVALTIFLKFRCWMNESSLQWIMYGPIVISLAVSRLQWIMYSPVDISLAVSSLQWITYGQIVIFLAVNIIFLINIVRLLMTKLKDLPEAAQNKKAARATLVLIPLLGFQYLLLPMRPDHGSPFEDVYMYCSAILTSCQVRE